MVPLNYKASFENKIYIKHTKLQLQSFSVSCLKLCFFDLSMSVLIFVTSFKSVCGRMSVDSKSKVILDEKLF